MEKSNPGLPGQSTGLYNGNLEISKIVVLMEEVENLLVERLSTSSQSQIIRHFMKRLISLNS
jgi:hypothetical protein